MAPHSTPSCSDTFRVTILVQRWCDCNQSIADDQLYIFAFGSVLIGLTAGPRIHVNWFDRSAPSFVSSAPSQFAAERQLALWLTQKTLTRPFKALSNGAKMDEIRWKVSELSAVWVKAPCWRNIFLSSPSVISGTKSCWGVLLVTFLISPVHSASSISVLFFGCV